MPLSLPVRCVAVVALVVLLGLVIGCEGRTKRVPVAGQVLIDGQPLTTGYIWLEPADDRPAGGAIDAQGRFRLTTYDENDGCVLGTHKVTVTSTKQLSPTQMQHLIPPTYRDSSLSDLTVTIDKPTDDLKIELTWGGKQPYVEDTGGAGDVAPVTGEPASTP
jgi:hypothetical protein